MLKLSTQETIVGIITGKTDFHLIVDFPYLSNKNKLEPYFSEAADRTIAVPLSAIILCKSPNAKLKENFLTDLILSETKEFVLYARRLESDSVVSTYNTTTMH